MLEFMPSIIVLDELLRVGGNDGVSFLGIARMQLRIRRDQTTDYQAFHGNETVEFAFRIT